MRRNPSKQRYLNAIAHKDGDEVPFQENQVDIVHVNKLLGRNYPLSMRSYEIPFEDQLELAIHLGNDMISVHYPALQGSRQSDHPACRWVHC